VWNPAIHSQNAPLAAPNAYPNGRRRTHKPPLTMYGIASNT